jgi:hypothetical protein
MHVMDVGVDVDPTGVGDCLDAEMDEDGHVQGRGLDRRWLRGLDWGWFLEAVLVLQGYERPSPIRLFPHAFSPSFSLSSSSPLEVSLNANPARTLVLRNSLPVQVQSTYHTRISSPVFGLRM